MPEDYIIMLKSVTDATGNIFLSTIPDKNKHRKN